MEGERTAGAASTAQPEDGRRLISLIMPVYNEALNIERAYAALNAVFAPLERYRLEFVFTDNHSEDGTFDVLAKLAAQDDRVKVLRFNRNYGFQRSLLTGYRHATGDALVQIDCDLQDPPALIAKFIELWEQGHDVVVGIRRRRRESRLMTLGRRMFYAVLSKISDDHITRDAGDFRLVDRSVVNMVKELNDIDPYVRGVVSSFARCETGILYDRGPRLYGRSKFPIAKLVPFAINGIVSHSVVPLRVATYVGLLVSTLTFCTTIGYLCAAIFFGSSWPSGFATMVVVALFGISLNAIFLGIIGEYISRIYQQVRYRPLVVVERAINIVQKAREI
jgi:glycosyltransferase involved in cell wall biosynthesis